MTTSIATLKAKVKEKKAKAIPPVAQSKITKAALVSTPIPIKPVIIINDNLLKVHKSIDLLSNTEYHAGSDEEFPAIPYTKQLYEKLLRDKVKFHIECVVNPDPANLIVNPAKQHGKLKWFTPTYFTDLRMYDIKLTLVEDPKKVKYCSMTIMDLLDLVKRRIWKLAQISGSGRLLTDEEVKELKVTLIQGKKLGVNFSYYQVKNKS